MSEETQNAEGNTATTETTTTDTTQAQTQETAAKESYQGPVDLSTLPDDIRAPIEARFSTLTRKMGNQERKYTGELSEWRKIAEEQSKVIEELQSGMGMVVDHLQGKSLSERETALTHELTRAHETGDVPAFIKANNDMQRLQAEKLQSEQRQKQQPKKERTQAAQNGQHYKSAGEIAAASEGDGELTSDDARAITAWQSERDASGVTLRPWSQSRTPDKPLDDARYRRAVTVSAEVFDDDPDSGNPFAGKSVAEKLAEVDRRMGVQKPASQQSVLGGSLTNRSKSQTLALSPQAENIAVRMKLGGPKASREQHIKAYRDQLNEIKGTR